METSPLIQAVASIASAMAASRYDKFGGKVLSAFAALRDPGSQRRARGGCAPLIEMSVSR